MEPRAGRVVTFSSDAENPHKAADGDDGDGRESFFLKFLFLMFFVCFLVCFMFFLHMFWYVLVFLCFLGFLRVICWSLLECSSCFLGCLKGFLCFLSRVFYGFYPVFLGFSSSRDFLSCDKRMCTLYILSLLFHNQCLLVLRMFFEIFCLFCWFWAYFLAHFLGTDTSPEAPEGLAGHPGRSPGLDGGLHLQS